MNVDDINSIRDRLKDITPEGREMAEHISMVMGGDLENWVIKQKEMHDTCPEKLKKDYNTFLTITLVSAISYITDSIDEALNITSEIRKELINIDSEITKNA